MPMYWLHRELVQIVLGGSTLLFYCTVQVCVVNFPMLLSFCLTIIAFNLKVLVTVFVAAQLCVVSSETREAVLCGLLVAMKSSASAAVSFGERCDSLVPIRCTIP